MYRATRIWGEPTYVVVSDEFIKKLNKKDYANFIKIIDDYDEDTDAKLVQLPEHEMSLVEGICRLSINEHELSDQLKVLKEKEDELEELKKAIALLKGVTK